MRWPCTISRLSSWYLKLNIKSSFQASFCRWSSHYYYTICELGVNAINFLPLWTSHERIQRSVGIFTDMETINQSLSRKRTGCCSTDTFHQRFQPSVVTITPLVMFPISNTLELFSTRLYRLVLTSISLSQRYKKNLEVFKRLSCSRILLQKLSYRLYYAYTQPYYQSMLNIYLLLSQTKLEQLEALNCRIFRIIHRWFDALNDEIINIPAYKPIELLTHLHDEKLSSTIIRTNPAIIADSQHKLCLLYMREYFSNPLLQKVKHAAVSRGRRSNQIHELLKA